MVATCISHLPNLEHTITIYWFACSQFSLLDLALLSPSANNSPNTYTVTNASSFAANEIYLLNYFQHIPDDRKRVPKLGSLQGHRDLIHKYKFVDRKCMPVGNRFL